MNAMLAIIFLCLGLGLAASRFGERVFWGVPALGLVLTLIYMLLPRYI
jgi:hypothetical protein